MVMRAVASTRQRFLCFAVCRRWKEVKSNLMSCARLGALEHGKWVHAYIDKTGMKIDVVLGTSLIDMYAKCGISLVPKRM